MVDVAAVQVRVAEDEASTDRVDRVVGLVTTLDPMPQLVVLPELWSVGAFDLDRIGSLAEPLEGPFAARMSALARATGVMLHAGSFPERDGDRIHNTSLVFAADGTLVATYRKIHLFGFAEGEAATVTAGSDLVTVETPLGRAGLVTCYDLRFPEQFRMLSARGAQVFLVPSGWPAARREHWTLLCRARALENQAVLVGANASGRTGGVAMAGHSVVVGPWGDVLAAALPDDEQILRATVDPAVIADVRANFPVLRDRRLG